MASSKTFVQFVMEQLREAGDVACRPMMGEYVLYYRGKVFGGVYDDRVLVKPVPAAKDLLGDKWETPYPGAKDMLMVEELENREFLRKLLEAMYSELPAPKPRKKKGDLK